VSVARDGRRILDGVDWTVEPGQRWVVLGPNGWGQDHPAAGGVALPPPTTGLVEVLGERLGRVDVRRHRARIGLVSPALADRLRPDVAAVDVVMAAREAALETWWHRYGPADRATAQALLDRTGTAALAERAFGTLSSGGAREDLVARLSALAGDPGTPPHRAGDPPRGGDPRRLHPRPPADRPGGPGPLDEAAASGGEAAASGAVPRTGAQYLRFAQVSRAGS